MGCALAFSWKFSLVAACSVFERRIEVVEDVMMMMRNIDDSEEVAER